VTDHLARNLEALARVDPRFPSLPAGERVTGEGSWKIRLDDGSIAIHGRDPQRDADREAAALCAGTTPSAIVAIGLGLGFLLDALERRGWEGTVIALEPEPETVPHLLSRRDWRSWIDSERLRLFVAPDFAGARRCWSVFEQAGVPPIVVNPALARARQRNAARARSLVDRLVSSAHANAEARRTLASIYLRNTLRNLPAIASEAGVSALADAARGVPAVVVAAGPSLDRALAPLAEIQQRALIIAVDTALRPLLGAGVTPHVVVAVDPTEENARHLTDLPPCPGTSLVAEGSIDPDAVAGFAGRTFFFSVSDHAPWPWLRGLGRDPGRLRAFGSVLTSAFDLALLMGCGPVIFAGADLAYTGGRPYARGVTFEHDWRRNVQFGEPLEQQWADAINGRPPATEPDVNGEPVRTAPHLVAFRDWLAARMQQEPDRRFINATGAGILHAGASLAQPEDIPGLVPAVTTDCAALVRGCHRPRPAGAVLEAAAAVVRDTRDGRPPAVIAEWEAFAPDLSREGILDALDPAPRPDPAGMPPHGEPAVGSVNAGADRLQALAVSATLVPMPLPPHRLQRNGSEARVFRFRTGLARIVMSVMQPRSGGVCEDGRALTRAGDLGAIVPGSYAIYCDEVLFRPTDDSDPRYNGRTYTVMVPPGIRLLEEMPLDEILVRDL
jgi:hypothetical protein